MICDGTASSTVVTPVSASAGIGGGPDARRQRGVAGR